MNNALSIHIQGGNSRDLCPRVVAKNRSYEGDSIALMMSSTSVAGIGWPTVHDRDNLFMPNMTRACSCSKSWSNGIIRNKMMRFLRLIAYLDS
jgi:hypothetical protein